MTKNRIFSTAIWRKIWWLMPVALAAAAIFTMSGDTARVRAHDHVNTSTGMTLAGAPLAIHGYDPVSYTTEGRARIGTAAFTSTHDGAAYRFASKASKEMFEKNPERYVPKYGGYCAYGVAVGAKFDGDPILFRVVEGKVYLNLNPEIQEKWLKEIPGNIAKADGKWTTIRDKAPASLP